MIERSKLIKMKNENNGEKKWYQFSLKGLVGTMTLVACLFGAKSGLESYVERKNEIAYQEYLERREISEAKRDYIKEQLIDRFMHGGHEQYYLNPHVDVENYCGTCADRYDDADRDLERKIEAKLADNWSYNGEDSDWSDETYQSCYSIAYGAVFREEIKKSPEKYRSEVLEPLDYLDEYGWLPIEYEGIGQGISFDTPNR
ncbi:hypothetical protein CMI42_02415 [Candidatus Pacearchaeota archaeon]|nr:hypothetical protein [Candidatus Pacearchaeota archaeon]